MANGAVGPEPAVKHTTPEDRGFVESPRLAPHLEFRLLEDDYALLVSEKFNTLLRGRLLCDLLPLLDGRRSQQEIIASVVLAHATRDVRAMISQLVTRGYVVSADYVMERARAAYWSSLGASPRCAEERLQAASVSVAGNAVPLVRQLNDLGIRTDAARPSLSVFPCADYLDDRHDEINRRHVASGAAWMLVRPNGLRPLFGPVFRPVEGSPCWSCLAYRLRAHEEVHNYVRNVGGESSAVRPQAVEPVVAEAICALSAAEIAKWFVLREAAPIHSHVVSLDVVGLESGQHPTMRRPQCPVCGDKALYRADRPAKPVHLKAASKAVLTSGGTRSMRPEETLSRYRHLISPITGVVTWLRRTADETDPWLQVYWAGNNYALRSRRLSSLQRSLRSKSAGKGRTREQAAASALCEAVERYSGLFHGDEIHSRKRFADFERAGEAAAIHPNDVQLFSDRQLDDAERINACGHPFNFVPSRLDPEAAINWSPVWSLTQRRHRYLPTASLYFMVEDDTGLKADSNGCAAGNTLEEAILQGFLELVERDAWAIWWYNRVRLPEVDLTSFDDDFLTSALEYYARRQREMWVLDATSDFGIPVFVAISRKTRGDREEILYGAGAHLDPHVALLRAVCELNQGLQAIHTTPDAAGNRMIARWWRDCTVANQPYLLPASGAERRGKLDFPAPPATTDLLEDVEHCRSLVEAKGMEFLVLDQTRPDIGMPVARVLVPGMRHFWDRFAPGRLFDVPVAMGWRESPLSENELNPVSVLA